MDNEMLSTAAAHGPARPGADLSSAADCESIVEAAIGPKPVDNDSLRADSHVESGRPHRAAPSE